MSKDAAKIRAKYPGHFPVICTSSDGTEKRKLLVPASMTSKEFESVAQDRCAWACAESSIQIDDDTISKTCSVRDIYAIHKAADDFLYVTVTSGRLAGSEAATVAQETAAQALGTAVQQPERASVEEEVPAAPDSQPGAPCVFHMPDHDQEPQSASAEAQRVRKVIKKYPNRVPVLVRQAATAGLPHIDRKLLVPKSMTASGLQSILPKHIAIPEDISVKWNMLQLFMGDEPIPEDAVMSDIYSQYVDEDDGGLHITLKIGGAKESQEGGEEEDAQAAYARQLKEALERAQEDADAAKHTAACAQEQAAAAEQKVSLLAEQLEQSDHKLEHIGKAFISETEKTSRLQAAVDEADAKLAEEAERHDELQNMMQIELEVLKKELEAADYERQAMQLRILEAQKCVDKDTDLEKILQDTKEMLKLETEKCSAVQRALNCCEEKVVLEAAQKSLEQKKLEEAERSLQILTEKLAAESAQKTEAREKTRLLEERLAALEEAEAKRQEAQRVQAAKEHELEAEGFVHLGWDRATGWATELEADDEEFEVLVDDIPATK